MPRQRSPLSSLTFPAQQQEAKDLPFASAHKANLLPTKGITVYALFIC